MASDIIISKGKSNEIGLNLEVLSQIALAECECISCSDECDDGNVCSITIVLQTPRAQIKYLKY